MRHQRRLGHAVPPAALLVAVLALYEDEFVLEESGIVRLHDPEQAHAIELGRAEQTWMNVVRAYGPVIHADTIHRTFADTGLANVTAYMLMRNSELVQHLGHGLYCLPGARITDGDLANGRGQAINIDTEPELRYGTDGTITFETTAQQYFVYNGSLSAGPAAVLRGQWTAQVLGEECGDFTVGQPWIFGLNEVQRRLRVRMGDRLRIRFDTWSRLADISMVGRANA